MGWPGPGAVRTSSIKDFHCATGTADPHVFGVGPHRAKILVRNCKAEDVVTGGTCASLAERFAYNPQEAHTFRGGSLTSCVMSSAPPPPTMLDRSWLHSCSGVRRQQAVVYGTMEDLPISLACQNWPGVNEVDDVAPRHPVIAAILGRTCDANMRSS
jgi:hypothetical protein